MGRLKIASFGLDLILVVQCTSKCLYALSHKFSISEFLSLEPANNDACGLQLSNNKGSLACSWHAFFCDRRLLTVAADLYDPFKQ